MITINRNNASGLQKTMLSVVLQTFKEFEYIVVDGASTDGSVEVIKKLEPKFGDRLKWISEPDKGVYNVMNKYICTASDDYIQIANRLASIRVNKKHEKWGLWGMLLNR